MTEKKFKKVGERDVDDIAAAWAARALSGDLKTEEKASLENWLSQDASHQRAYDSYMLISSLSEGAGEGPAERILEQDLAEFAARSARPRIKAQYWVTVPAIAAGLAVIFVVIGLLPPPVDESQQYATLRGESLEVTLDDQSVITLNTETSLEILYTDESRIVELSKGEAFFDVASNEEKPFHVISPYTEVTVTGTSFSIRAIEDETQVSVFSGAVNVASADLSKSDERAVRLSAGQSVTVERLLGLKSVKSFDVDAAAGWRWGMAYYEGARLGDVVADLNRYFERQFVLGDEALAEIPVSGGFDVNDQEVAIEALSVALSLRVERRAGASVVLWPKE